MNRLAIVVPNFNGANELSDCLNSLLDQSYDNFQIIVVENGSSDKSIEIIKNYKRRLPEERLHVIYNSQNLGFAGGVNSGIRYALESGFDGVALFNNDAVADKNWLKELAASLKPNVGIVTGLLLHNDGKTIDSTGDYYSIWGLPFPRGRNLPAVDAPESGEVFGASGGASLYSCKMLREIGLFDENFFAYYEDVDVSFRAQLSGWKVVYTKKAIAYHKQGVTSKKIPGFTVYQTFKNLPLLFVKNVPAKLLFSIGVRFYFAYYVMLFNAIIKGHPAAALKGYFAHIWYFWTSSLWKRHEIQKGRKVDIKYIRSIIHNDLPPDQTGLRRLRKFFAGKP